MRSFIIPLVIFCLSGCAMASYQKVYPLPESGVTVVGDKIYHNEKPFAELRYLATDKQYNTHRGLAIYYYPFNKEVWIYPKGGWRILEGNKASYSLEEIESVWHTLGIRQFLIENRQADKSEFISAWCYDIRISDDGKYIYYKTQGMFYDSSHKYLVEYGVSK